MKYLDPENRGTTPPFVGHPELNDSEKYIMSEGLKRAVEVAMFLGQPLLVTGEPGTGKTRLAHHLAHFFNPDPVQGLNNLFVFNTKTTSKANDLFYRYDSLKHFQYVQTKPENLPTPEMIEELFIEYQALGKAIRSGKRCVVLIDEIDKAPRDLPNDILDVMEKLEFEVPEISKVGRNTVKSDAANRPIVILTSNSERNLPDAFLRRCMYFHIPFPGQAMLTKILNSKLGLYDGRISEIIVHHFQAIRGLAFRKKPSTAELLHWGFVLDRLNRNGELRIEKLDQLRELTQEEKEALYSTYGLLIKDKEDLQAAHDLLFENKRAVS